MGGKSAFGWQIYPHQALANPYFMRFSKQTVSTCGVPANMSQQQIRLT